MTQREFLNAVINESQNVEIINFAENQLEKLDERNKKRSSSLNARQKENEVVKNSIVEYLEVNGQSVASDIAKALDISTQKASALCRQLVESGSAIVEDIKIPKKGKVKAYSLKTEIEIETVNLENNE